MGDSVVGDTDGTAEEPDEVGDLDGATLGLIVTGAVDGEEGNTILDGIVDGGPVGSAVGYDGGQVEASGADGEEDGALLGKSFVGNDDGSFVGAVDVRGLVALAVVEVDCVSHRLPLKPSMHRQYQLSWVENSPSPLPEVLSVYSSSSWPSTKQVPLFRHGSALHGFSVMVLGL